MKDIIRDLAAARAPRYTSYPTTPHFSDAVSPQVWSDWLARSDPTLPVSLYLHIPFCREICWYCACNMKLGRNDDVLEDYTNALSQEIGLVAKVLGARRKVSHIHWGGGTPTAIGTERMARLMDAIDAVFDLGETSEIAVELDPRTFDLPMAPALARMGVTRASLGVQAFDTKVQSAINRVQSFSLVNNVVSNLRLAGVRALNFDMMYGLPHQSPEILERDLLCALMLHPDRIALFGYAHVPWAVKRQRKIDEAALPDTDARVAAALNSAQLIEADGMIPIGLDHFARPEDSMAEALQAGRLRRNFQGYTVDNSPLLLGLGASSISEAPQGYAQNRPDVRGWAAMVEAGSLPIAKGVELSTEDRLRRGIIEALMCFMQVDLSTHLTRFDKAPEYFDQALQSLGPLEDKKVVRIEGRKISVNPEARSALRLVASKFDAYQGTDQVPRHSVAI